MTVAVRLSRGAAALVLLLALLAGAAIAAPAFPALSGRVVDEAQILSPQTEADLTARLATLETQTHRQLVVVTLQSLQNYEIEEYGYQLGRAWGIGRAAQDDGVLLIVAPNERKVRIEVGYGLEGVLTDALSSVILQERVLPRFREGDMEGGVVSGTDALITQLSLPADQAAQQVAAATGRGRPNIDWSSLIVVIVIILWFTGGALSAFGRRRRRRRSGLEWLAPVILSSGGSRRGGWGGGSGWSGGGGFSGGGGSFGGGGSSGSW